MPAEKGVPFGRMFRASSDWVTNAPERAVRGTIAADRGIWNGYFAANRAIQEYQGTEGTAMKGRRLAKEAKAAKAKKAKKVSKELAARLARPQTVGNRFNTNTMDQIDINNLGAAPAYNGSARDLMNNGPGADRYSGPVAQYNPDGTVVGQEPPPAAPSGGGGGGGGGGAYATPNYAQQAQDSMGRVNNVYDESAKRLALLNQQREQANAFTNQDVAASGAQRFAEMQQQLGMGYQDDSTRAAAALQLDGLRNNNQAQDEYSRRMGQMDQLDYNTALGMNSSNRAASQLGIMQDVAAQRAEAASGGGGGGGGGGADDGGAFTDSAISSRLSVLNAGQPKYKSAVSLMMDRYGQLDGKSKLVASVRDRVKKAKGSNIASLQQYYGKKHKNNKGVMVYDNPRVMELLDQAQKDRRAHHSANQYTAEDAVNSLTAERGF